MATGQYPSSGRGFIAEMRSLHWAVKLIILIVLGIVLSPFFIAILAGAFEVAGGFGVLAVLIALLVFGAWFVASPGPAAVQPPPLAAAAAPPPPPPVAAPLGPLPKYCNACGATMAVGQERCTECDSPWVEAPTADSIESLASLLNDLATLRRKSAIDAATYVGMRGVYEARLAALRPAPPAAPPVPAPAAAAPPIPPPPVTPVPRPIPERVAPVVPRPAAPPPVPGPTAADVGRAVVGWAAERQADILLYVGAFLLSVAAVIFVAYQGEALNGTLRFIILTAYALGFLGFGLALHRWERVREAGPVFLALGAILIPVDFVALRTQVLTEEEVPLDVLWLFGSGTSAVLYFVLALRGYGRLYVVPGIPAALAAWGSLASVVGLPFEWFGLWFELIAAPAYVVALWLMPRQRFAPWLLGLALMIGVASLAWVHGRIAFTDADRAALPSTYTVATLGLAGGLWFRRDTAALLALPAFAGMTAATVWWSAFGLDAEWAGLFIAGTSMGYLFIAHFMPPNVARRWGGLAAAGGAAALIYAHSSMGFEGAERAALPATYGVVFVGTAGSYGRWRWREPAAALPPLGALTLLTTWWAARGLALEWYGSGAALAALGYLALAQFDRPERTPAWRWSAAACAALALGLVHTAVGSQDAPDRASLPVTYALVLAGSAASFVRWRWDWRTAPGALPALAAMTALATGWARWELDAEWYGCFAAAAGLGYLALGHFDEQALARAWGSGALLAALGAITYSHIAVVTAGAERAPLPAAYAIVFVGAAGAFGRWRWIEAGALLPPLAAMTALSTWWAATGLAVEWYGAFAAAAALGYLLLAHFDRAERTRAWQTAAALSAALGLVMAHATVAGDPEAAREALPLTYAIVVAGSLAAFGRWRFAWRVAPAAIPLGASMTALTFSWARWDLQPEWYGAFVVAAAFGYLALSTLDQPAWHRLWLGFAMASGTAAILLAHGSQTESRAAHAALPVTYGQALVAAALTTVRWRWDYREAVAAIPPLAAAFGASLLWAAFDMRLDWLTAWTVAGAAGYLVPALLDATRRDGWRQAAASGFGIALVTAHGLATVPELVRWQLPLTYAIVLAGSSWDAARMRGFTVLAPPILASIFGAATLWAADIGAEWWPYPALGVAAAMAATSPWWQRNRVLGKVGWLYLVLLGAGATIAVLPVDYTHPEHGVAAQAASAVLLVVAAFGARGTVARLLVAEYQPLHRTIERVVLLQAGCAFLIGAGASLNGVLELEGADRAWTIAGLGTLAWFFVAALGRRADYYWTFAPVALVGMTIASVVAADSDATLTAVLTLATVGPLVSFAGTRRWMLLGVANSFLFLAVWGAWEWRDRNIAYLPLAFAAIATLEWAALIRLRRYTVILKELDVIVAYLSWGPWLVSGTVASLLLAREQDQLIAGESVVSTEEWALAAAVLAMASAAVMGEGIRLRLRWVWLPGSTGLLAALLMAIATWEPENVQAYTAPIGAYLVLASLTFRRSPDVIARHLQFHEAVMLVGVLFLVLPPAEQSFEPGGGKFGLELIGIGLALLAVGLLLHARWLVPAAIATLTGVSIRLVTGGLVSAPYWLLLGVAGTVLIGFGLLVLLERERWDNFRHRVVDWWNEASRPGGPLGPPAPTAGGRA